MDHLWGVYGRLCVSACLILLLAGDGAMSAGEISESEQARAVVDSWVHMWNTYDIREVERLFCNCDELSYFSSEREGLIQGYDAVLEHHRGFGFDSTESERGTRLWLDQVDASQFGSIVVVTAIWFFQRAEQIQQGPVTIVLKKNAMDAYEIVHMNFSSY